jgi:hypothetical protein
MEDTGAVLAQLILGASESVDVLGNLSFDTVAGFHIEDLVALSDRRLRGRLLLRDAMPRTELRFHARDFLRSVSQTGWEVRTLQYSPTVNCVIVDGEQAVMSPVSAGNNPTTPLFVVDGAERLVPLRAHFERLWSHIDSVGEFVVLHESLLLPTIPAYESQLAVVSNQTWAEVIADLATNPDLLYSLHPRKFEELVAELLARKGMTVTLTPTTRDGGRDILALSDTGIGKHLYLVECKRYAKDRPVDVSIVRALYGVLAAERATAGLLVTTSYFTKSALSFRDGLKYQLALKEYEDLVHWLRGQVH